MDRTALKEMLTRDEGNRLRVYDDATGKLIGPGSTLVGHPTIGIGRALDVHGISSPESTMLLDNDVCELEAVAGAFPWFNPLDSVRQDVVLAMIFNFGIGTFAAFHDFQAALGRSDYPGASTAMLDSAWAKQEPDRAHELSGMMTTGRYPSLL